MWLAKMEEEEEEEEASERASARERDVIKQADCAAVTFER